MRLELKSDTRQSDTAPPGEFIAAGAVLAGLGVLILGFVIASSLLALLGVAMIFGITAGYAIFGGSLARSWRAGLANFGLGRREPDRRERDRDEE